MRPGTLIFGIFVSNSEAGKLAPIEVVMLPEAVAYEAWLAAFERKAGSTFPNKFMVSLLYI